MLALSIVVTTRTGTTTVGSAGAEPALILQENGEIDVL
jgi:serine phosphatase RsbU (regulator of sigma subunit)